MMTKAIYAICVCAAVGSLGIGFASGVWSLLSGQDAWIVPLVAGPYAVIAAVAWWRRSRLWESSLLLGTLLLIGAYGLVAISVSAYRFHTGRHDPMAMDLTPLVVPALQWLVAVSVAALLGAIAGVRAIAGNAGRHGGAAGGAQGKR